MIFYDYLSVFYLNLVHFLMFIFAIEIFFDLLFIVLFFFGAGKGTLMSISDGLDPYTFRRKMEKTGSIEEEMVRKLFISRQSRHISFVNFLIKVLLPILYLVLVCKQFCFPPRKRYK